MVAAADGVRLDDPFFLITQSAPGQRHAYTVLTLLAKQVVAADVETDGVVTDRVLGLGVPKGS
jgi:hypothetical protein